MSGRGEQGNDATPPPAKHSHEAHDPAHIHDADHAHAHATKHDRTAKHDHLHDAEPGHDPADGHDHSHSMRSASARKLTHALLLTGGFLLVEVVGGMWTHSLALLSDAAHMLTDTAALALALFAQRLAERPRSKLHTYGLRRAETLAALANGVALGLSAFFIVREGIERWSTPLPIHGAPMFVVATLGLVVNLVSAKMLSHGHSEKNANVRAAMAHVLADALGSVAAMVAGVLVVAFGWTRADAVVSVAISLLILWSAYRVVRDASRVLMEGTPEGFDLARAEAIIAAVPGVASVHDLHVWAISEGAIVLTVHVVLEDGAHGVEVVSGVRRVLRKELDISHVTVQPEAGRRSEAPLLPAERLLKKTHAV